MSKLFCVYDKSKKVKPNRRCDICGVLMCKFCGYHFEETNIDYCNKCYEDYGTDVHRKTEKGGN